MQIPPPPEEAATHLTTPKERLEKQIINENVEGSNLAHTSHQGAGLQGSRKDLPATATSEDHVRRQQQQQVEHQLHQQAGDHHQPRQAHQQQQQGQGQQHHQQQGRGSRAAPPQQASYAAALRDLAQAQGNSKQETFTSSASPLLPKTSLADIQKGFGEAIAASMFSAPGLVRTTAAPNLMPPMLPMLRLPGYTHPPFHHPQPSVLWRHRWLYGLHPP